MRTRFELWDTEHEKDFIDKVGTKHFSQSLRSRKMSRITILEMYRQALKDRVDWGKIKKSDVMSYLIKAIKVEYAKGTADLGWIEPKKIS